MENNSNLLRCSPLAVIIEFFGVVLATLHVADGETHSKSYQADQANWNESCSEETRMLRDRLDKLLPACTRGWRAIPDIREQVEIWFAAEPWAIEISLQDFKNWEVFGSLNVVHDTCVVWAFFKSGLSHIVGHHVLSDFSREDAWVGIAGASFWAENFGSASIDLIQFINHTALQLTSFIHLLRQWRFYDENRDAHWGEDKHDAHCEVSELQTESRVRVRCYRKVLTYAEWETVVLSSCRCPSESCGQKQDYTRYYHHVWDLFVHVEDCQLSAVVSFNSKPEREDCEGLHRIIKLLYDFLTTRRTPTTPTVVRTQFLSSEFPFIVLFPAIRRIGRFNLIN